jgi:hypothetical protein
MIGRCYLIHWIRCTMKDWAKQSSSSWYQSARLITVQFSVIGCDDMVLLLARDWSTIDGSKFIAHGDVFFSRADWIDTAPSWCANQSCHPRSRYFLVQQPSYLCIRLGSPREFFFESVREKGKNRSRFAFIWRRSRSDHFRKEKKVARLHVPNRRQPLWSSALDRPVPHPMHHEIHPGLAIEGIALASRSTRPRASPEAASIPMRGPAQ